MIAASSSPPCVALLVLLMALGPPSVIGGADGPTYAKTFAEGPKQGTLVVDCTHDKLGTSWQVTVADIKFSAKYGDFPPGTVITGIDVTNLKTKDQADIAKTSGGVGQSYVWFHMKSVENHGLKFQFKIWGNVPRGAPVKVNNGQCS